MAATHTTPWTHEGREYEVRWRLVAWEPEIVSVEDPLTVEMRPDLIGAASIDADLEHDLYREAARLEDIAREDAEERRAERLRDERRGL